MINEDADKDNSIIKNDSEEKTAIENVQIQDNDKPVAELLQNVKEPHPQNPPNDTGHHSKSPHHPPREPRTFPRLFPTFADLPYLIVSPIGTIFQDSQANRHPKKHPEETQHSLSSHHPLIDEDEDITNLKETWSEFCKRRQGDITETALETLYLQYSWPSKKKKRCSKPGDSQSQRSCSSISLSIKEPDGIYEKQVITSEIDAFITLLEEKRLVREGKDDDTPEYILDWRKRQRRCTYVMLVFLMLIVVGNLAGGIHLLKHAH